MQKNISNIKELITEYAAITGRPVATLSVSEFLELKQYVEKSGCHYNSYDQQENIEFAQKEKNIEPDEVLLPADKGYSTESRNDETDGQDKNKREDKTVSSAFMMMRAIKG